MRLPGLAALLALAGSLSWGQPAVAGAALEPESSGTADTAPPILVVSGASAAGKTTLVRALENRGLPGVACYYWVTG